MMGAAVKGTVREGRTMGQHFHQATPAERLANWTALRDRAEERVQQLRSQLASALEDYGRCDREVYKWRQVERSRAMSGG